MFELKYIYTDNLILEFKKPLKLNISINYYGYIVNWERLNISAFGESLEDLINSFKEKIIFSWKKYVEVDEQNLSDNSKIIRYKLMNLIREI